MADVEFKNRRNEFVRKMKHFCPSLTPWKIIINWTRRNEAYWQAIDSCTRKIRKFSTNRRCLFRRIFDWNYLKLRSRLYRNLDCLFRFTSNWRWRKRFFFNWVQPGSRDGPRSGCSIVDLRVEVHLPLASALCDYRSMTKFYPQYRSSTDRRIDFNRVDRLLLSYLCIFNRILRLKEEPKRVKLEKFSREIEKKNPPFIKAREIYFFRGDN